MAEIFYTITELEKIANINRRTVHYYVNRDLIPPPQGQGGAAKYGEIHHLRLRLIKYLQKSHFKLSGIKQFLDSLDLKDLRKMAEKIESDDAGWENESLARCMLEMNSLKISAESVEDLIGDNDNVFTRHCEDFGGQIDKIKNQRIRPGFLKRFKRPRQTEESPWHRINLADGLEINIREDLLNERDLKLGSLALTLKRFFEKRGKDLKRTP